MVDESQLAAQSTDDEESRPEADDVRAATPARSTEEVSQPPQPSESTDAISRALAHIAPPEAGQLEPSPQAWLVQDKKGRSFGPITREELQDLARARTLTCECRVRRQTSPVWLWAVEVFPDLADDPLPDELPEDYADETDDDYYDDDAGQGGALDQEQEHVDPEHAQRRHHRHRSKMLSHRGSSIMLLGLMGFLCGMFGIAAAVMGAQDIRTMRRGDMDPLGYDLTMWGAIIGAVGTLAQCGLVAYLWATSGG